jgi:transcriptional regulator of acetoin/glycerol metabolism
VKVKVLSLSAGRSEALRPWPGRRSARRNLRHFLEQERAQVVDDLRLAAQGLAEKFEPIRAGPYFSARHFSAFSDEVGDIPLELQPKLLRVLQEQEFERLGSARTQRVDVRMVAATNCDLEQMVAAKQFRGDLFYRLNVFPITIPPLRERREDIPLLVRSFAQRFAHRMKKRIDRIPTGFRPGQ